MKMKQITAYILLAAMLFLCGCQPTPDVEYVVNKGDNRAEEIINATALPTSAPIPTDSVETQQPAVIDTSSPWTDAAGQAVFPERWEDHIKTQYKEMIISADVITGGIESYPVRLVRKNGYSDADIYKVAEYLFHDVTGWRRGTRPTRQDLMDAMEYAAASDMTEQEKDDQLEALRFELESTSDSNSEITPCESVYDIPSPEYGAAVFTETGGGMMSLRNGSIYVITNLNCAVQYKSGFGNDPDMPDFTPEISLDEAKDAAREFFGYMGIEGFDLYFSDEARCVNGWSTEVIDKGWKLSFIRSFGYLPFSVSQYNAYDGEAFDFGGKWDSATELSEPIREEKIDLYVSSRGIEMVSMTNPYEVLATVNENVQLYDFDELTKRIMLLFTAAISKPFQSEGYYVIEQMILTVVPQPKKDSSDYYMMPVWVCKIGEYVSIGDGLGVSPFYIPGEQVFDGWLTVAFNAIDGTRVSLPKG